LVVGLLPIHPCSTGRAALSSPYLGWTGVPGHGEASNEEGPAGYRAWAGLMGCAARDSNPEPLP
jgi:hypothetical protein